VCVGATRIFWDPSLDAHSDSGSGSGSDILSKGEVAGVVVGSVLGLVIAGSIGFYVVNHVIAKKRSDALLDKKAAPSK
jgi:hypothetical protein